MTWVLVLVIVLLTLLLSGFFSGSETGLYCVSRLRVEIMAQRREPSAVRLSRVLHDERATLAATLIGTNLMNYLATVAVAYAFSDLLGLPDGQTEIYTVVVLTPIVFAFGEVVPKNLFQIHADWLMTRCGGVLLTLVRAVRATGTMWVLTHVTDLLTWCTGGQARGTVEAAPKRRVAALLREALAGTAHGETQSELVDGVVQISETPVHAGMVPRNKVVAIPASADRAKLIAVARRTRHTRLPVYKGNVRRIIGLIKVEELLLHEDWNVVEDRLRPITTLDPHRTVAAAIAQMQQAGHPMAVVVDRTGLMLGLVTIKDLVEELVGELTAW